MGLMGQVQRKVKDLIKHKKMIVIVMAMLLVIQIIVKMADNIAAAGIEIVVTFLML